MKTPYKGYVIEVHSYRSGDAWRPDVRVSLHEGGALTTQQLVAPADARFKTEVESDAYGAGLGTAWIDGKR